MSRNVQLQRQDDEALPQKPVSAEENDDDDAAR